MSDVTIVHNPDCGTSRNVLALIRHADIEPVVIEYLKSHPPLQRSARCSLWGLMRIDEGVSGRKFSERKLARRLRGDWA